MSKTSIDAVRLALSGPAMGSRWTAVAFAPASVDAEALAACLAAAVETVEQQMSTWRPDSDLMRLNGAPVGEWISIPADLAHVLAAGLRIGRLSEGAFDIGVGRAVASWGFGAHAVKEPGPLAMRDSLAIETLDLDERGQRARKRTELTLDLSAIAKGFGVDALARALDAEGIADYLVGIDGELRAKGLKPDGEPFAVALERPEVGVRAAMGVVALENAAVATSGDYRHFRDAKGVRVSHTIDPRTGAPVSHALASVTVLAPTAMEADAFATALIALGPERGRELARALDLHALFITRDAQGLRQDGVGLFAGLR